MRRAVRLQALFDKRPPFDIREIVFHSFYTDLLTNGNATRVDATGAQGSRIEPVIKPDLAFPIRLDLPRHNGNPALKNESWIIRVHFRLEARHGDGHSRHGHSPEH